MSRRPYSNDAPQRPAPGGAKSVWVFGPQGCGKTLNAPRLARYFGLPHWRDWEPGEHWPATDHLILAVDDPRGTVPGVPAAGREVRVYTFAEAMRLAGVKTR